jgi:hypothetical protein
MNVFFIYLDPDQAARHHGDKHVIKMILESVQLLFTCWHVLESPSWVNQYRLDTGREPYKRCYENHPCAVWVRARLANYTWLVRLARALCAEKRRRWPQGREHACAPMIEWLSEHHPSFPDASTEVITPPPKAMPTEDRGPGRSLGDSLVAYRTYYGVKARAGIVRYDRDPEARPAWMCLDFFC